MRQRVGSRELKTRLGTYLRRVRRGATLVVTDRGEPVAELCPVTHGVSPEDAGPARLEVLGAVTRHSGTRLAPMQPVRAKGRPASQAVTEGREDRFCSTPS